MCLVIYFHKVQVYFRLPWNFFNLAYKAVVIIFSCINNPIQWSDRCQIGFIQGYFPYDDSTYNWSMAQTFMVSSNCNSLLWLEHAFNRSLQIIWQSILFTKQKSLWICFSKLQSIQSSQTYQDCLNTFCDHVWIWTWISR